jgi:hypothetical protein
MRSQLTPVVISLLEWSCQNNNQIPVFFLRRYAINGRGVVNIQTPRPSTSANPLKLATITIEAVDRIGLAACVEIEKPLMILSPAQMNSLTIFANW